MNDFINQIKKYNTDLKASEIEGLFYILKTNKPLSNNNLVTMTGIPKETLRHFKKSISGLLEDNSDDSVSLNKKGKETLENLELFPYKWSLCESFDFTAEKEYQKFLDEVKDIKNKYSSSPKREFDQFLATPETSLFKARIIDEKGLVEGKSIAFIGDDDLNSLSLASINSKYKNITVFDIDPEILGSIKKCCEEKGFKNIETVFYDVRKNLDLKFLDRFDVVVFDPPYTKSGVTLFLERSIELLGDVGNFEGKYIFMYYGNSFKSPEKILKIQEIINRFGLSIEDRIEKFARYKGAESIGAASSLYILKASKFTHKLGSGASNIYTFEKVKEEKFPFVDHMVFKVFDAKKDFLKSKGKLLSAVEKICRIHRLKIVDKKVTDFKNGGMTVTFVLANSNLVVHTWPEFDAIHLDLITCSPIHRKELLSATISDVFGTSKIDAFYVE